MGQPANRRTLPHSPLTHLIFQMKGFLPTACAVTMLALGACNADNKAVETTAVDTSPSSDTAVVIRDGVDAEAMYRANARRVADRVYTDFKLTDTATRTRLSTVYYTRAKRMGDLRARYTTTGADTMGQYRAMRDAEMESNKEFQPIFTDPKVYTQYESRRSEYDRYLLEDAGSMSGSEGSMPEGAMPEGGTSGTTPPSAGGSGKMSAADQAMNAAEMEGGKSKLKMKGEDGSKIKIKDGDVKLKDADGKKSKINGD